MGAIVRPSPTRRAADERDINPARDEPFQLSPPASPAVLVLLTRVPVWNRDAVRAGANHCVAIRVGIAWVAKAVHGRCECRVCLGPREPQADGRVVCAETSQVDKTQYLSLPLVQHLRGVQPFWWHLVVSRSASHGFTSDSP